MQIPMRCFYRSKDSPLNKLSNDLYSIIFYGKELTCHKAMACLVPWLVTRWPFQISCDIYIYLELACHDKQNGGQSFNLRQSLTLVYGKQVFSDAAKNGTISAATNGE